MGMSYAELSLYGRLRKVARAGPVAMYNACADMWRGKLGPAAVATKVGNLKPYIYVGNFQCYLLHSTHRYQYLVWRGKLGPAAVATKVGTSSSFSTQRVLTDTKRCMCRRGSLVLIGAKSAVGWGPREL